MRPPVLVTAPAAMPIDAAAAKLRAPVLADLPDPAVDALIEAAVSHLDGWSGVLGRCIITQTWRQDFDGFCRILRLPFPNVSDVVSVTYDGGQVVDAADYELRHDVSGDYLVATSSSVWPSASDGVSVTFKAGYGAATDVPAGIKQAVVLMAVGLNALTSEAGQRRSFEVSGGFTETFNSPDMMAKVTDRAVERYLAPYRRLGL